MISESLLERLLPWIEEYIGVPLSALGTHQVPVLTAEHGVDDRIPLLAVRFERGSAVILKEPHLIERLAPVVSELDSDMIFSTFGC